MRLESTQNKIYLISHKSRKINPRYEANPPPERQVTEGRAIMVKSWVDFPLAFKHVFAVVMSLNKENPSAPTGTGFFDLGPSRTSFSKSAGI